MPQKDKTEQSILNIRQRIFTPLASLFLLVFYYEKKCEKYPIGSLTQSINRKNGIKSQ